MARIVRGFTLIELMIAVALVAVLVSVAIPAYNGYVSTSRQTEGWNNLRTLQIAEEEYFLDNNSYFEGIDAAALKSASGGLWQRAETDADANFEYAVDADGATYTATATGTGVNVETSVVLTVTKN
jgi:type IV pilus assembly protein PilE